MGRRSPITAVHHDRAAEVLGIYQATSLARRDFRLTHRIPFFRLGRKIAYDPDALRQWLIDEKARTLVDGNAS